MGRLVRLARLVYHGASVVLDKATGELVERATFQAYGGAESDYRPGRWANFREDYRFTGKEEDVEVGLQYFGKRFLNPLLGRWVSADPLAIHAPGEADLNVYAYVSGAVLKNVDPLGLEDESSSIGDGRSGTDAIDAGMAEADQVEADLSLEDSAARTGGMSIDPAQSSDWAFSSRPAYPSSSPQPDNSDELRITTDTDVGGSARAHLSVPMSEPTGSESETIETLAPAIQADTRHARRDRGGAEMEVGFIIVETADGYLALGPIVHEGDGVHLSGTAREMAGPIVDSGSGPRATLVGGTEDAPMSMGVIHAVVHTHPDRNLQTGNEPSSADILNADKNAAVGIPHGYVIDESDGGAVYSYDQNGVK